MQGKRMVNAARLAALRRKGSIKESAPAAAAATPPKSDSKATRPAARPEAAKPAFDPYKPVVMKSHEGGVVVEKPAAAAAPAGRPPPTARAAAPAARPPVPAYRRAFAYVVRRPPPPPPPSRPKWPSAIASFLALGLVIAVLATPVGEVFFDIYRHPFYDQFPETARIRAQRTLNADMTGGSFDRLGVDLPKPPDIALAEGGFAQRAVTQPVTGCTPSCPPATSTAKPHASLGTWGWFEWDLQDVQSAHMTILYDFETRTIKLDLHPADAGTVDQIDPLLVAQYIGNANRGKEWLGDNGRYKIDPENPVLTAKAIEVSRDKATALEKAQAIYFFLQGSYSYKQGDIGAEPKDAFSTYNDAAGDCDEVSFLFISMLRAVGIPAWPEFGILYDSLQERWVGHAWVQFVLPTKTGQQVVAYADPVNFQWLFRSANRITEWVSDGDPAHMEDFYHAVFYQFQSGTPSFTDQWKGIQYEGQGVVYNQDTSREIRYVPAAGVVEVIGALAAAMMAMALLVRRRAGRAASSPKSD